MRVDTIILGLQLLAFAILGSTVLWFRIIAPMLDRKKRCDRRVEESLLRPRKPLSPLSRQLVAERAAALNDPGVEEAHVINLRSMASRMRDADDSKLPPSRYCCLNFGCPEPEICDGIGFSCGDPRASGALRLKERIAS